MAIEKKSLISTLKTTKKANMVSSTPSHEAARFSPKSQATKKPVKSTAKIVSKIVAKKPKM